MVKRLKKKSNERGQATIEFVLVLTFLLGFVFFNLQFAMVSAFGSYVQYATFMSARTLMAATKSDRTQRDNARRVLVQMLKKSEGETGTDRWPMVGQGVDGNDDLEGAEIGASPASPNNPGSSSSSTEGVRYTFKSRLFFFWFQEGGGVSGKNASANYLTLTSESWLGREPTYDSCLDDLSDVEGAVIDNGC